MSCGLGIAAGAGGWGLGLRFFEGGSEGTVGDSSVDF